MYFNFKLHLCKARAGLTYSCVYKVVGATNESSPHRKWLHEWGRSKRIVLQSCI